jgi:hypothetical protein
VAAALSTRQAPRELPAACADRFAAFRALLWRDPSAFTFLRTRPLEALAERCRVRPRPAAAGLQLCVLFSFSFSFSFLFSFSFSFLLFVSSLCGARRPAASGAVVPGVWALTRDAAPAAGWRGAAHDSPVRAAWAPPRSEASAHCLRLLWGLRLRFLPVS